MNLMQRGATWLRIQSWASAPGVETRRSPHGHRATRVTASPQQTITVAIVMMLVLGGLGGLGGLIGAPAAGATPGPGQSPGIDISSYQHPGDQPIDWKAVRASGMRFVYIKASEPTRTGRSYNNPWFARDWVGAAQAGLYRGAYHFAQPRLPLSTAEQDAQQFLNVTGPMNGPLDLPPVLDLEATGGLSAVSLTTWTARWLAHVQRVTGKKPIIYSGWAFWKTALDDTAQFNGHQLWMARWQTKGPSPLPGGWQQWKIWQYGTTNVAGIKNTVDANVMCGAAPTAGAPAGCAGIPEQKTIPTTTKASTTRTTFNLDLIPVVAKRPVATTNRAPVSRYAYTYTYRGKKYADTGYRPPTLRSTPTPTPMTVNSSTTKRFATGRH